MITVAAPTASPTATSTLPCRVSPRWIRPRPMKEQDRARHGERRREQAEAETEQAEGGNRQPEHHARDRVAGVGPRLRAGRRVDRGPRRAAISATRPGRPAVDPAPVPAVRAAAIRRPVRWAPASRSFAPSCRVPQPSLRSTLERPENRACQRRGVRAVRRTA